MAALNELRRLVSAVEALSLEEQTLLNHRQYEEMIQLQSREAVLVSRVSELISTPSVRTRMDDELWSRIRAILVSFSSKSADLDQAMAETRLAIAKIDRASSRARQLKPAYAALSRHPFGAFAGEG